MADATGNSRSLARNIISYIGFLIATLALVNILFLLLADFGEQHVNPYVGIFTYVILPGFLLFGLVLVGIGMLRERRRRRRLSPGEVPAYPRIDLNQRRTRLAIGMTMVAAFIFFLASALGSYKAYHYTDTDAFCGVTCHSVMHPEYTAYKQSPHARVGCVTCHIGSGATWFVRSKLSGAYQVYATLANKYPKPIPTPVANLRPAQDTCETCHWPEKFWGAQLKVFNHFGYDEANTPRETRMLINTGGGSPTSGITTGIHWHMNIANRITYVAKDEKRQEIEWVELRDRSGRVTEYRREGSELTPQQIATMPRRVMDCVDCHNRPTHIYQPPDRSVDRALLANRINRTLPYIKQQGVTALTKDYSSTDAAMKAIKTDLDTYYQENYPDLYQSRRADVLRAIQELQAIFRTTRFPEMKVDWRTHPDNVGHFYFAGCFRCHDDQMVSSDGKKITKACEVCHTVLGQAEAGVAMISAPQTAFEHPIDIGDLRDAACTDCHTGGEM